MERTEFVLIGRKLGHSDSAIIHKKFGLDNYRLAELEPEEIEAFLQQKSLKGINVTIPYKRDVIKFLTELSPEARDIGGVNTIVFTGDNKRIGHNTDMYGLIWMAKRAKIDFQGKKVLVFGSGGASRAAVEAAKRMGAKTVVVISRTGENHYGNLSLHADAEILINATPVGMYPNPDGAIADLSHFPKAEGAIDMVYNPSVTEFIRQARSLNIKCTNGLPMLVAQAKAAEEHFLGTLIDDCEIERVLNEVNREKTNIALIGMPGSGKSAIGEALIRITGREGIDTDREIEKEAGMSIPEYMKLYGVTAFRDLESSILDAVSQKRGVILITGGGAVLREENQRYLRRNSRIYHILRDVASLPREGRPLSINADLEKMQAERMPFYKSARDLAVENNRTIEDAARAIWRDFLELTHH